MKNGRVRKIDFSRKHLASLADKYYNEGKFIPALRLAYKELDTYGGDGETFARLSDIYEGMSLQGSAINWWFRFLDIADEEDLPDVYEGLAVNYLAIGNEGQSAYYYNRLIDADDSISDDIKLDIAEAFSHSKQTGFRFVYPPRLADYSKEVNLGAKALKNGDCKRAIAEYEKVEKGAKEYVSAKEMQAVAHLLCDEADKAESICLDLLADYPDNIRVQATLAAVYLEQGRAEKSREIAIKLANETQEDADDLYKVATVCCENEMHEEAYQKFVTLDKKMPFDGRMLYFKAVAAYKSGKIDEAEDTLDSLCTIYPDAEVAKYYLRQIRLYKDGQAEKPELIYFYHLPQEERENRCRTLLRISEAPKDEAQLFGLLALHDGYFRWCFDEMDGADRDLQYLALVTAVHVHADEFIKDVLLDYEVLDVLKIETLRLLLERNEDETLGLVLCNIYKKIRLYAIKIGRKRRKKFIEAYAKIASKFVAVNDTYAKKIKTATENLYRALEDCDSLDLIDNSDDCACAIFLLSGLKELGGNPEFIASAFDANLAKAQVIASAALYKQHMSNDNTQTVTNEDEETKA